VEGKEDVAGGAQEVTNVEGSVLNLDLELFDLGQEGVDNFSRAAEKTEQFDGVVDEFLELSEDLWVHDTASLD